MRLLIEMNFKEISVVEALKMFESGDYLILDVRSLGEFDDYHHKDALHIVLNNDFEGNISKFDREKKYLVHCLSGARSHIACQIMKKLGFVDVYNVLGPM
jgi:hydroxyacylglutathione hydrolase